MSRFLADKKELWSNKNENHKLVTKWATAIFQYLLELDTSNETQIRRGLNAFLSI